MDSRNGLSTKRWERVGGCKNADKVQPQVTLITVAVDVPSPRNESAYRGPGRLVGGLGLFLIARPPRMNQGKRF